ncbi:hypothetical protein G3T14_10695 [Methylobacterium sp. BTF04]|uniref:hypothetical protein n=1 Tax=Methylobacterium sp. BTF04 TaxID=2708300 RepID=UPI0013D41DDB|nr:hypothetical protein [Methylobacterium sp. BTF04]NEU12605.1 hypothetical protein [Methylobacterium sp. BTF04]
MSRVFDEYWETMTPEEQERYGEEGEMQEADRDNRMLAEIDRLRAQGLPVPRDLLDWERSLVVAPYDPSAPYDDDSDIPF